MKVRLSFLALVGLVFVLAGFPAGAAAPDPAARGLDVFLHVPDLAPPGGKLPISVTAFGFATATKPVPLAGASLEVGWEPDSLDGDAAPPSITATADAEGRATFALPVPVGKAGELELLVAVRSGTHARTRSVKVRRAPAATVEIHTPDRRVVPSSTISAWARVVDVAGRPLADTNVDVVLLEAEHPRHRDRVRTDRGGVALVRVPIPSIEEPTWSWTLQATADLPGSPSTNIVLEPREETPGIPVLEAGWDTPPGGAKPGDPLTVGIRVRDASGAPVANQEVRFKIGPENVETLSDEAFEKVATVARTDATGRFTHVQTAPTLVKASGTTLTVLARARVDGYNVQRKATVSVGQSTPHATVLLESRHLVPGIAQRVHLVVEDARGEPVAGRFEVKGDGLAATVTTDPRGEAAIPWSVPAGIGAFRGSGPCSSGVAAAVAVRPLEDLPALGGRRDVFTTCVQVDREADALVRVEPAVARAGEAVDVVLTAPRKLRRGASAVLANAELASAVTAWLAPRPDGTLAANVTLPEGAASGLWSVTVVQPEGEAEAVAPPASFLVTPRALPSLEARVVGGRVAPGGTVEVLARLTDGHGKGLPGAVSAVVVDAFGGGRADVSRLDTRTRLCRAAHVDGADCAATLEREAGSDDRLRGHLGDVAAHAVPPLLHPFPHAKRDMESVFATVVRSVEGAVYESLARPDSLVDVRRKEAGRWVLNPEILSLATEAMPEAPVTPGGEPITLADVVAMDPQVTFDNVARRVTRMALFELLVSLRAERRTHALDPEEPVWKDPNALLRRMVRAGSIPPHALLDPWGGTIAFVRTAGPQAPFLGIVRGWELHAPGPDGVLGTADDIRDPFERVLKSGSPYAEAVGEDRIVDAKWDMQVADESVESWKQLFEELTGRRLGLQGTGSGGGGSGGTLGFGSGHGSYGRGMGTSTGDGFWSAPVRTDADGRVRITVPLGDVETTWHVALVGVPDGEGPASTVLPLTSALPVSARVVSGARWTDGDVAGVRVVVRNRTQNEIRAQVRATPEGAIGLDRGASGDATIVVAAGGAAEVKVPIRANAPGEARLVVTTRAPGIPEDTLRHTWEVKAAGEKRVLTRTSWVDGARELGLALDQGYRLHGAPRLVLERGYDDAIAAALDSLEPERQTSLRGLVDALDAATRIQRWATAKDTPRARVIAEIAAEAADRASARAHAFAKLDHQTLVAGNEPHAEWTTRWRLHHLRPLKADKYEACPPATERSLDAEPPPGPDQPACWAAFVSQTTSALATSSDAVAIADAVNAIADRPHHASLTASLGARLRAVTKLRADGTMDAVLTDRADRSTVYAALLRTARPAEVPPLFGALAVLRDVTGGYGSSAATLAAVRAILSSQLEARGATRVHVRARGVDRVVDVPESGFAVVDLADETLDVKVDVKGPGVVARFERPILRAWSRPPPVQGSHATIALEWPAQASVEATGTLKVTLGQDADDTHEVDARIPLPPGAELAAAQDKDVRQLQGTLAIRARVARTPTVLEIPIRFGLAGRLTVPEAVVRLTRAPATPGVAPARSLVIR